MHSDLYLVMYKPPNSARFFPIIVFDTLQAAHKYIKDNEIMDDRYYVDLIKYIKE